MSTVVLPPGVEISAPISAEHARVLTPEALEFLATLERAFASRRAECLAARAARQREFDAGALPQFLESTRAVREGNWTCAPIPADIVDRRVEITGPVDRKMVINALNSGANVFMADFEDANTPTWGNNVDGQVNLVDAVRRRIEWTSPEGRSYRLNDRVATLFVRPRGLHLDEKHVKVDGRMVSGGFFDFALYCFHNAKELRARGSGPYFYLPKLEGHREARLWNDVFAMAEDALGLPRGAIKATVLIETILAAFEMDEILFELREHSAGLNAGRWDYIFSCIKKLRVNRDFCLADRAQVTMTTHFMRSYAELLVKTCHRRGTHAMGGMAAQIPVKHDERANAEAFAKVRSRQGARGAPGARRHVGRASGPGGGGEGGVRPPDAGLQPDRHGAARRRPRHACRPAALRARDAHHGRRRAPQHQRRHPVRRRVARRTGRGADPQPDGGRCDRRDLALAAVAMDPLAEGHARRWPQGVEGDGRGDDPGGTAEDPHQSRRCVRRRAL